MLPKFDFVSHHACSHEAVDVWMEYVGDKRFSNPEEDKPTLADLTVFGVIRSLEGLDTFKELMDAKHDFAAW